MQILLFFNELSVYKNIQNFSNTDTIITSLKYALKQMLLRSIQILPKNLEHVSNDISQ